MYVQLFEGLRSYYSSYPARRESAGFHAAMTLSMLCCFNVASLAVVLDRAATGNIVWASASLGNWAAALGIGLLIASAHCLLLVKPRRATGPSETRPDGRWRTHLAAYSVASAVLFVSAVWLALVAPRGR